MLCQSSADRHGNIALLEHLNINTDLPLESCTFFVDGLGFTHDCRQGQIVNGKVYVDGLVWVNAGMSQVHLPVTTRGASGAEHNVLDGSVGVAFEDTELLCERLRKLESVLSHTKFSWSRLGGGQVEIRDPNGNLWVAEQRDASARDTRGHHPGPPSECLGITHVEFNVPLGAASGIADFYRHYLGAITSEEGGLARVAAGPKQELRFRERKGASLRDAAAGSYENDPAGLHIAIYVYDLLGPMQALAADGLLWPNPRYRHLDAKLGDTQFRCKDVVAPGSPRQLLYELEHEVRNLQHQTSPFQHPDPYQLLGREPVRELVSAVTDDFERDFAAEREACMRQSEGFLPRPLGVALEPIELFTWGTPDGKKVSIALEELRLPYDTRPIDIERGEQDGPELRALCPNGKIPAIRDPNQGYSGDAGRKPPLTVSESGAILLYLAERYGRGRLLPRSPEGRTCCLEWIFFQVAGLGPMAGQVHHFAGLEGHDDPSPNPGAAYGFQRYSEDVGRQYGVMDAWLADREFFTGHEFTIADIAVFPWVWRAGRHKVDLEQFPNVKRWYDRVASRPAVGRGLGVP